VQTTVAVYTSGSIAGLSEDIGIASLVLISTSVIQYSQRLWLQCLLEGWWAGCQKEHEMDIYEGICTLI